MDIKSQFLKDTNKKQIRNSEKQNNNMPAQNKIKSLYDYITSTDDVIKNKCSEIQIDKEDLSLKQIILYVSMRLRKVE